jgi:hypothetical protein
MGNFVVMKQLIFTLLLSLSLSASAVVMNFSATFTGERVELKWYGTALQDDYTYVIQRSKDGQIFKDISILHASATNEFVEFFDVDTKPSKGITYYRIKQVGVLGDEQFSDIVVIQNKKVSMAGESLKNSNVLVVVQSNDGTEYYGKVFLESTKPSLQATDLEQVIPSGTFRIIATSKDAIRDLFIRID